MIELNMYPKDHTQQHSFIINSHNSYMTANFIAFYMEYSIDLFILFPHTSHLLQSFDLNVFALLKHVLTEETNAVI